MGTCTGAAMSAHQPWKRQRLDEPKGPTSNVLTFFSDGSFRRIPVEDSEATPVPQTRTQITTVFAADGRFVHLRETSPIESHSGSSGPKGSTCESDRTLAIRPSIAGQDTDTNGQSCQDSTFATGLSTGANTLISQNAPKSWLESRLERAKSLPEVRQDTVKSRASGSTAADVMVEVRVAKRSPTNSTASAARLRINASSTDALDKVLTESVGGLLSAMKPALS